MFKHLFLSAFIGLSTPLLAFADPVTDVIEEQLDAFLDRDAPRAFSYASPQIQGMFGTPLNFAMMVERGYPSLWSPGAVEFSDRYEQGARVRQTVIVTGPDGKRLAYEYDMLRLNEDWKINGVRLVPLNEVGV